MKHTITRFFAVWAIMASVFIATTVFAAIDPEIEKSEPHKMIASVTDVLTQQLADGLDPEKDKATFNKAVIEQLEPIVAFDFIAKGVMGNYAKRASPEQIAAFTETFKKGLLSAYGKGLANIQKLDLKVLPPEGDISGQRKVAVLQEVSNNGNISYVSYTMAKSGSGDWKLINVVFNGVNLGKTFRGQFAQTAQKFKGNIDEVIANWDESMEKAK